MWASYKKRPYSNFYPELMEPDLDPKDFAERFEYVIHKYGLDCFILKAETERGLMPVGYVLLWARGRLLEISNFIWFDWASHRNCIEAALNFLNQFRSTVHEQTARKYKLIGFVEGKDRPFFDHLCKYKVLRMVGKVYDLYEDGAGFVYETRT
jgi:hypothetical protein